MKKILPFLLLFVVVLFSCESTKVVSPVVSESQVLFEKLYGYVTKNDVNSLNILVDETSPKMLRSVIDSVDNSGRTLLQVAIWDENQDIVKILLENGASKLVKDNSGKTAIDYAQKIDNKVIRSLLGIEDGKKKEVVKKEPVTSTKKSTSIDVPNKKSSYGFTDAGGKYDVVFGATDSKLLIAIKEQNYPEVKKILESGFNVNDTDLLGNNGLFYVINNDNDVILNLLISYNINCNYQNKAGQLPLLYAVEKGNITIINTLIKAGSSINKSDIYGVTPELLAVQKKDASLLKFIESKGAYLSSKDLDGNSLLHIAVKNEDITSVKFLLAHDCDVWATNDVGVSVLEIMQQSKHNGIKSIASDYE